MKKPLHFLSSLAVAMTLAAPGMAAPPTNEAVGDADSFGNRVNWIGVLQTGFVALESDCTVPPFPLGPNDRCVTVAPPPAQTSASFVDLGSITLPKNSSDSLLCHWITPNGFFSFLNPTGSPVTASFRAVASYRLESAVLNDPGIVAPGTGQPYNGAIEITLPTFNLSRTLAPGEMQLQEIRDSRICIGGLISQQALVEAYGLSEAQAKKFFKEPITIRGGMRITANWIERAGMYYGTRFMGDRK